MAEYGTEIIILKWVPLAFKKACWKKIRPPISRSPLSSVHHFILFSFLFFVYKFANLTLKNTE